jgi:hypothetical protein
MSGSFTKFLSLVTFLWSCNAAPQNKKTSLSDGAGQITKNELDTSDLPIKLNATNCIDPDLSRMASDQKIMLCNGNLASGTLDLSKLSPDKLLIGTTVAGVDGALIVPAECNQENQSGCIANDQFPAVDRSQLAPEDIRVGKTVAGVSGSKWPIKICKNGRGYLLNSTDFSNPWEDATPNSDSSVDDYHGGHTRYAGNLRSNCNESNFADVSNSAPGLGPDPSKSSAWTHIHQDLLTGTYFTNPLANASANPSTGVTWASALTLCNGLSGGTGGSGWRLPTQKELLQLYVNGLSSYYATDYYGFWASTTSSAYNETIASRVYIVTGHARMDSFAKTSSQSALCVRTP